MASPRGPRFSLPPGALDDTDKVHQLAPPQRIRDDMAAGPHPVGADGPPQTAWQALRRNDAAPSDATGEYRMGGAEQHSSNLGMHPICADHRACGNLCAVREYEL